MDTQDSGWLWLVINVGMVAILGLALAWGALRWRTRTRAQDAAGDRKAPELAKQSDPEERE